MSEAKFEILKSKYYQNYLIPSYSRVTGLRDKREATDTLSGLQGVCKGTRP